jgi:hypothetical protein
MIENVMSMVVTSNTSVKHKLVSVQENLHSISKVVVAKKFSSKFIKGLNVTSEDECNLMNVVIRIVVIVVATFYWDVLAGLCFWIWVYLKMFQR